MSFRSRRRHGSTRLQAGQGVGSDGPLQRRASCPRFDDDAADVPTEESLADHFQEETGTCMPEPEGPFSGYMSSRWLRTTGASSTMSSRPS